MGSRRRAREIALQMLYQFESQPELTDAEGVNAFFHQLKPQIETEGAPDSAEEESYAEELVRGVRLHLVEIDAALTRASRNWRLERMAQVDRNLLRLACYEMKHGTDVPGKVVINEAIEISKRYGTAESPAFVNGILDRCLSELGPRSEKEPAGGAKAPKGRAR